jgi:hypothetical protein
VHRIFWVGAALGWAGTAWAGELWLAVDVEVPAEKKKVHIEIPYTWLEVLNLDDEGLEKAALEKAVKGLEEGAKTTLVDGKEGDDVVRVVLSHRPDSKGPVGTTFFMETTTGDQNMAVPLSLLVQMAPMAAAMSGESGAVDIGKCLTKLDEMRPFTLLTVDSPSEHVEIGVR